MGTGVIVWFTGLPSAGKTTVANLTETRPADTSRQVEVLNSDVARQHLPSGLGSSKRDRGENVRRIGYEARLLTRHGVSVLTSPSERLDRALATLRVDLAAGEGHPQGKW